VIVLIVLLFFTKPLQYMPETVLSTIVFLIGIELIDVKGMRKILRWRADEFVVAAATALVVVVVGVEQGILLAIVLSVLDHLRRSYHPRDTVLSRTEDGKLHGTAVEGEPDPPDLEPGLVVYRFGANLYYANANRLTEEIRAILGRSSGAPAWLCIEAAGIDDVDFSGGETILDLLRELQEQGTKLVFADVDPDVRAELDRYGVTSVIGAGAYFDTVADAVEGFGATTSKG
jgi:MFS superfamily sulfate permease-like transporter